MSIKRPVRRDLEVRCQAIPSRVVPEIAAIVGDLLERDAVNYALSGWVDWKLAAVFVAGGAIGGLLGARVAAHLSATTGMLRTLFAGLIFAVAAYILWRSYHGG